MILSLPKKVRPGEPVDHETINGLIDAVRAVCLEPGTGYQRRITRGGTVLRILDRSRDARPGTFSPFEVVEASKMESGDYEVELEPGRVRSANPVRAAGGGDGWDYAIPTVNGTPMDEEDEEGNFPRLVVPVGKWIYCKVERDPEGVLVGVPEMVVDEAEKDSTHYQPVNPLDSGVEEKFQYVRIVAIEETEEELALKVWRKSDIELVNQLWAGRNVGAGGDPFKRHNAADGRWEFRRTHGRHGIEAETAGDNIEADFDGENLQGEGSAGGRGEVYVVPPQNVKLQGGKAQFREIVSGPSGRDETKIEQGEKEIRVMGNAVNGSLTFVNADGNVILTLKWQDGYWKTPGDHVIQVKNQTQAVTLKV